MDLTKIGFAFVIQKTGTTAIGKGGCDLGYAGIESSLAVEFDTYQNFDRTADPNDNHISVQTCGKSPNTAHHNFSQGCTTNFGSSLRDGKSHVCKITYVNKELR